MPFGDNTKFYALIFDWREALFDKLSTSSMRRQKWYASFVSHQDIAHDFIEVYDREMSALLESERSNEDKELLRSRLFLEFLRASLIKITEPKQLEYFQKHLDDSVAQYKINIIPVVDELFNSFEFHDSFALLFIRPNIAAQLKIYQPNDAITKSVYERWAYRSLDKPYCAEKPKILEFFESIGNSSPAQYRDSEGRTFLHLVCLKYTPPLPVVRELSSVINELDIHGNSALYYLINENKYFIGTKDEDILKQLLALNARYIRNFYEEKTPLHIRVAARLPLELNKLDINAIDLEHGRSPLHYATLLKNTEAAFALIEHGASCSLKDKWGKTAFSYACLDGNTPLIQRMLPIIPVEELKQQAYLVDVAFSGNTTLYNWMRQEINAEAFSELDRILINQVENGILDQQAMQGLDNKQKLSISAAFGQIATTANTSSIVQTYVTNYVLPQLISDESSFAQGRAYGVELEISDLPCMPGLPIQFLQDWFKFSLEFDGSVSSTIFSNSYFNNSKKEIVSKILYSPRDVGKFLQAAEYLYRAGATVGYSTGMHVHVNVLGKESAQLPSITAGMQLGNASISQIEIAVVKQIIANWIGVEPLLSSILRYGVFLSGTNTYTKLISNDLTRYLSAENFTIMLNHFSYDRYMALNIQPLSTEDIFKGHGTIEVRIHEGATHPTNILAWMNFVHRLVSISIHQIQTQLDAKQEFEFLTFSQIKALVYIWLAERNYKHTWDNKLMSFAGSSATFKQISAQTNEAIYNANIYELYNQAIAANQTTDIVADAPIFARPYEQGNISEWIALTKQFTGIIVQNVTSLGLYAVTTVLDSNREYKDICQIDSKTAEIQGICPLEIKSPPPTIAQNDDVPTYHSTLSIINFLSCIIITYNAYKQLNTCRFTPGFNMFRSKDLPRNSASMQTTNSVESKNKIAPRNY
jgi:ankyrin repeat protein